MPNAGQFKPGQSGNPTGRNRRYWITVTRRCKEAKKSFEKLCEIRDGTLYQRTVEFVDGEAKTVDVVPSVKEVRESCKTIMAYAVGMPTQQVEVTGQDGDPFAFNIILQNGKLNGTGPDTGAGGFSLHYRNGDGDSG